MGSGMVKKDDVCMKHGPFTGVSKDVIVFIIRKLVPIKDHQ